MPPHRPVLLAVALALVVAPMSHGAAALAQPAPDPAAQSSDGPRVGAVTVTGDAGPSSLDRVYDQTNTTSYLGMPDGDVDRSGYGDGGVDVTTTVAADVEQLQGAHAVHTFEASLAKIESREKRIQRMNREADRVQERIDELNRRQAGALDAYNDGDLSTEQFVRELVAIDAAARQVDDRISALDRAGRQMPGSHPLWTRLQVLRASTVPLTGNARAQVAQAMTGNKEPLTVYVAASSYGVVLATNDEDFHYREAYLANKRQPEGADQFAREGGSGVNMADERASQLYPWTYSLAKPSVSGFPDTSVYYVRANHPHGELDTYLDGATRDVFRELQTKRLDSVPTDLTEKENGLLRIQVYRTHSTGPMRVVVSNPNTDQPVSATVRVNGRVVGSTGGDGAVWTTTPHNAVRINATTPDGASIEKRFFAND